MELPTTLIWETSETLMRFEGLACLQCEKEPAHWVPLKHSGVNSIPYWKVKKRNCSWDEEEGRRSSSSLSNWSKPILYGLDFAHGSAVMLKSLHQVPEVHKSTRCASTFVQQYVYLDTTPYLSSSLAVKPATGLLPQQRFWLAKAQVLLMALATALLYSSVPLSNEWASMHNDRTLKMKLNETEPSLILLFLCVIYEICKFIRSLLRS